MKIIPVYKDNILGKFILIGAIKDSEHFYRFVMDYVHKFYKSSRTDWMSKIRVTVTCPDHIKIEFKMGDPIEIYDPLT